MSDSAENSSKTAKRPRGRPFPKGTSGNAGGRPKSGYALREMFKEHGAAAIGVLVQVMHNAKNDATRIAAAKEVLERAYGPSLPAEHLDPYVRNMIHDINREDDEQ